MTRATDEVAAQIAAAARGLGARVTTYTEGQAEWGIMDIEEPDGEPSAPPPTPWSTALWWGGVGALLAGIGVLGYALAVAEGVYPTGNRFWWDIEPAPASGVPLSLIVVTGTTAATLAWVFLALRRAAARRLPPAWATTLLTVVPVVGTGLLGHAMTGDGGFVTMTVLTALATVTWTYLTARWIRDDYPTCSFPDPQALVTVILTLAVVALGVFARWRGIEDPFPGRPCAADHHRVRRHPGGHGRSTPRGLRLPPQRHAVRLRSRRGLIGFIGGMTAIAMAIGLVVAVAGDRSLVNATTTTAVPPPPTPTDLTRVTWRWSAGEQIHDVIPAGAGVVVSTSRGIIALDGRTGQERWHYRRTDTEAQDLEPADDGRMVIASFEGRLHAFDAFTGELRWRDEPATAGVPPAWIVAISATESTAGDLSGSPAPGSRSPR